MSNTPLLFFRSMYREPTPAFFPYPLWIRPSNGCTCRRCMQLCRSCPTTRPSRFAMQSEIIGRSYGCENSNIYVMVTAPPLFSAPGVGDRGRDLAVAPYQKPPPALQPSQKILILRTAFSSFTFCRQHLDTPDQSVIKSTRFGSLNRYFAYFAPDPDLILSVWPWSRQLSRQTT